MSIQAILMPMFAQVALTFVLLFWMTILRLRVIRKGEVRPQQVALREPAWPPHVIQVGDALDVVLYVLSWMFVLSRLVHAYIHVTSNRLDRRTAVFLVGAIALALI